MANTRVPNIQVRKTETANYGDAVTPSLANYETNTVDLEDDLNNLRSVAANYLSHSGATFTGNWYDDLVVPSVFSSDSSNATTIRGINPLNNDLYGIQRQRILKRASVITADFSGVGAATFFILTGATGVIGTLAAVGAVTTTGTVVATAGTFAQWDSAVVTGANALQPKNLCVLIDDATGEPVIGGVSGKQVYALLQGEATLTDGDTITASGGAGDVQFSFVVHNGTNDGLIEATASDLSGITFNYAYVRRDAFEDCPEEAWLGEGFVDSGVANATRQAVYDNAPNVLTVASATLDIGSGFLWEIGDSASAPLMTFTESGASSTLALGSNLTTYTNNAVTNLFTNGIQVDTSDPIHIGNATSGADTILFSGNALINGGTSTLSLQTTSNSIDITTNTGGAIDIQAVGAVTIDSSGGALGFGTDDDSGAVNIATNTTARAISIGTGAATAHTLALGNTGAGAVSIDSDTSITLTATTGTIQLISTTSGEIDISASGLLDINASANMDVDVSGTYDLLASGVGSIDFLGDSNISTTSGDMTVGSLTTGDVLLTSADCILGTVGASASDHERWSSRHHYFGRVAAESNYVTLNAQNIGTGIRGGTVVVTSANTYTPGSVLSASTATTFTVDAGAPGISAGDFLLVTGASVECVNGLYQIDTAVSGTLTIDTTPDEEFCKTSIGFTGAVTGTLFNADVCVMRCNASGVWEVGDGTSGPITYTALGTAGGVSLDTAYIAGNTITFTDTDGPVEISNTSTTATTTTALSITNSPSVANTGNALTIAHAPGASSSGDTVNISNGANVTGDAFNVNNLGSGSALLVADNGTTNLQVAATGAVSLTPTTGTNLTGTTAGVGAIDFDTASGDFTVDSTAGAFSVDVVTDSNLTVDAGTSGSSVTMSVSAVNDGSGVPLLALYANNESATGEPSTVEIDAMAVAGNGTVEINAAGSGGVVTVAGDAVTTTLNLGTGGAAIPVNVVTGGVGTVSIATGAFANTVDINDTTGAATTNFNAGTGGITGTTSGATAGAAITNTLAVTNTDNTVSSSADTTITSTASGASGAVLANVTVDAIVGNVTGTATGNFMNDGSNPGIVVANIASGATAASNTVNVANVAGTGTVNILNTGTGSATFNLGNTGSSTAIGFVSGSNTLDFTDTGVDADTDWVISFPTKNHDVGEVLDVTALPNVSVRESTSSKMFYNNGASGGDYFSLYGVGDDGRTATTATTGGTFWLRNLISGEVNAPVSFVAGTAVADAIVNVAVGTGTDYATGDVIAIQGANLDINNGFFLVSGVSSDAVSVYGTFNAMPAGFEGFQRQFTADTSGTGSVGRAIVSGIRMAADGTVQVMENADTSSATWTGILTAGVTLASAVATVGSSAATMDAAFAWSIADADNLEWLSVTGTNSLLNINPASGADAVSILTATEAGSTFTSGAAINVFTTGISVDGGTAADAILIGATSAGGSAGEISTPSGPLTIDAAGGALSVTSTSEGSDVNISTVNMTADGTAGQIDVTAADAAGLAGAAGGIVDVNSGNAALGAIGAAPVNAGIGGLFTATAGNGGDATGSGTVAQGSDGGIGGAAAMAAGNGGVGDAHIGVGEAGNGGTASKTGGIGGAGAGGATASEVAADGGDGGGSTSTGGRGGSASAGTGGGPDAGAGNGGDAVNTGGIGGAAVAGVAAGDGGDSISQGGAPGAIGAGTAGAAGIVISRTSSDSVVTGDGVIHRFDNVGSGTNGGAEFDIHAADKTSAVGGIDPAFTATTGSLYVNRYSGATADLWFNAASGQTTGDSWEKVVTSNGAAPRQFAQCVINTTITGSATEAAGTNLTQAKCSSGTMPTRVSGHDFDTQSEIYFNGVMMMNATGNDVKVATIGTTAVDIHLLAGVQLISGDVVSVVYYNI